MHAVEFTSAATKGSSAQTTVDDWRRTGLFPGEERSDYCTVGATQRTFCKTEKCGLVTASALEVCKRFDPLVRTCVQEAPGHYFCSVGIRDQKCFLFQSDTRFLDLSREKIQRLTPRLWDPHCCRRQWSHYCRCVRQRRAWRMQRHGEEIASLCTGMHVDRSIGTVR